MIIGDVMRIAQKHETRLPITHLVIDESHNYSIPQMETILTEARKYNLHLTLGTQSINNYTDTNMKDKTRTNCFSKMAGYQPPASAHHSAALTGLPANTFTTLKVGEFIHCHGEIAPFKARTETKLRDWTHCVPEAEWKQVIKTQQAHYYRKIEDLVFVSPRSNSSTPPVPDTDNRTQYTIRPKSQLTPFQIDNFENNDS